MKVHLKPLNEQVVVITGGSSGIGLATARMAAERGARVVLCSRDTVDLRRAVRAIQKEGGEAVAVVADVADLEAMQEVAEAAVREFGGLDTWINNAGVSIYGQIEEVPLKDARRLFDTNYWGVVNGSLAAIPYLRESGGALINVGSILSDLAIPLQGHYSASKHAVKGFTDALRVELEADGAPISVTLIKPSAIDTPYPRHAKSFLDREPTNPAPVYAPETVARTILHCAERPEREVTVGGGGRSMTWLGRRAPKLTDRYMEAMMFDAQKSDRRPSRWRRDTLHKPRAGDAAVRGDYPGHVMQTSAYTRAALHPIATLLGVAVVGVGIAAAVGSGILGPERQRP